MLKVQNLGTLILGTHRQTVGAEAVRCRPVSPFQAVAFWASKEFGVWNQERVKPRFRLMESGIEGLKSMRSKKFSSFPLSCMTLNSGPSRNRPVLGPIGGDEIAPILSVRKKDRSAATRIQRFRRRWSRRRAAA